MQVLEKKTKGFTLLELLVVIAILGILSAAVYPNFSSWIKERKVRHAAEKIKYLISSINTQVQRGSYELVQVRFIEDGSVTIFTSGIGTNSLAAKKKDPGNDFNKKNTRCNINNDYWDDLGSDGESPGGVGIFMSDEIAINFASETHAVCFSKDGSYFSDSGIKSPLIICLRRITIVKCNATRDKTEKTIPAIDDYKIDGDWIGDENYIYGVEWTRFGSVAMMKWVVEYERNKDTNKKEVIDGKWVQR